MNTAKHFLISGRVQGVFFRAATQKKATELGLTGWVKNTDENQVEVLAIGTEEQLKQLEKWLWQGPPAAKVTDVHIAPIETEIHSTTTTFSILRD